MKTVTLPIEEYEQLLQDSKDKQQLMEENAAKADERGYMVRYITQCWRKASKGWDSEYEMLRERNTLEIFSKDKVLADAQKEIERLTKVATELADEKTTLSRRLMALECRGFWARVFNKKK
jgi:hypothetical protein